MSPLCLNQGLLHHYLSQCIELYQDQLNPPLLVVGAITGAILGIAFIIPPEFSAAVAVGAAGGGWWAAKYPAHHEDHAHVAASGLLAGAGVTGVITAMVSMARG